MAGCAAPPVPPPPATQAAETGEALSLSLGQRRLRAGLMQAQGERRLWRSPAGVVVATDGARVVATAGLGEILVATRFDGPDPLRDPATLRDGMEARRLVDLMGADRAPGGMRFGIAIDCRVWRVADPDTAFVLIEERCSGAGIKRFVNRFWVTPGTGAVAQSEQWIGVGLPPLVIRVAASD